MPTQVIVIQVGSMVHGFPINFNDMFVEKLDDFPLRFVAKVKKTYMLEVFATNLW